MRQRPTTGIFDTCLQQHLSVRDLTPQVQQLVTYAIAGADGLFIAKEIGGDSVDLLALFALHAHTLYYTALRPIAENAGDDV